MEVAQNEEVTGGAFRKLLILKGMGSSKIASVTKKITGAEEAPAVGT
jgi:hypothetical protein